jgi:hypothetical protein
MKKYSYLFLALLPLALTACSSDEPQPDIPNEPEPEVQPNAPIVVNVDNDGKAEGGHTFEMIDETNFYIDDVKYTTNHLSELMVSGYHKSFFEGEAKLISALKYHGRELKVTSISSKAFSQCRILTAVSIPDCITDIYDGAFNGCTQLTSVNIPATVKTVGYDAFLGCTSLPATDNIRYADTYLVGPTDNRLTAYNIKEGTRFIGDNAFYNCQSMTSIRIPEGVNVIGRQAFWLCKSLATVNIPESAREISFDAFEECNSLSHITISCPTVDYWFNNHPSIEEITLGDKVTTIKTSAFRKCSGLTTINIPESVRSIGSGAFDYCSSLTTISIPEGVTSIEGGILRECPQLTDIYCYIKEPPALPTGDLVTNNASTTLHVPAESVDKYKAAKGWNFMRNIVAI